MTDEQEADPRIGLDASSRGLPGAPMTATERMMLDRDIERENAHLRRLLTIAQPYLDGIISTNHAPFMDSSAYPGWGEPRRPAKRQPAEWWLRLSILRDAITVIIQNPNPPSTNA